MEINDYILHIDTLGHCPSEYGYGNYVNATHNGITLAWEKVPFGASDAAHEAAQRRVRARARYALKKDGWRYINGTWS